MAALQKLQEKIEQWRADHEALKSENAQLKVELANVSGSQNAQEAQITSLKRELEEKDAEIEKIIAQVEALLA
ncbi:hypothetical protein [Sulfurovum sp. TSL1]|uniref:hypothetical protein n=1 Tax=Sulfurovum sp. TSL1 TaxID=2826994 RepID=UPI001CC7F8EF|nr:hypothetical protein [Sulfurovum sp. TSL1]GIT98641.1 hypothetical protein TSL1_14620 [Sulfurovum sp. TSL1]